MEPDSAIPAQNTAKSPLFISLVKQLQKEKEKIENELANSIINDKTADDINNDLLQQLNNIE